MEQIVIYIGGILIAIIGFFLRKSLDDIKSLKDLAYRTDRELEVLKTDYINKHRRLEEKFDDLYGAVKDLTLEIKSLNTQLSRKKDI